MSAPLPQRVARTLENAVGSNPGLLFDRGFGPGLSLFDGNRTVGKDGMKAEFLEKFCADYARRRTSPEAKQFEAHQERRRAALKALGTALPEPRKTTARLVIGLGLPQPVDTGFLFDRLTGVPYLPGSSIKGLLRQTARLVVAGELEASAEDRGFWAAEATAIFGPAIEAGVTPRKGKLVVYEAFPTRWPELEVEVLTPHHADWFGDQKPPGDWEDPTPVPFLTVKAGTSFRFAFRVLGVETDLEAAVYGRIERLLDLGLDWLGVGGKRTSGYGVFGRNGGVVNAGEPRTPKAVQPAAPPTLEDLTALVKGLGLNDAAVRVPKILDLFAADPKLAAQRIVETLGKGWKDAKHRDKLWAVRLREILQS